MVSRRGRGRNVPKYPRVARVNQLLQEVVAEAIEDISQDDPRLELTTVTSVEAEPNLASAVVWIANLNQDNLEALEEYRKKIQGAIATQVRLKRTPLLRFAQDQGVAQGGRIDEILRRLSEGRPADTGNE